MSEEDIKSCIVELKHLNEVGNVLGISKHIAIDNALGYINKLETKLMYALSPTNHELALTTKVQFRDIIRKNIEEDTNTIKNELKKSWKGIINHE